MERIYTALSKSWQHDHISFLSEMIGVAFTIAGSLLLALTANNPNMLIVFPLYEVGSLALMYAYYRREMIWSIVLTGYFVVVNIIGFIIAWG